MKVLIALPAYNEEAGIRNVLRKIARYRQISRYEITVLVVDDGSHDNTAGVTAEWAADADYITLIRHPGNKGLGTAVRTIFDYALDKLGDDDILVTMDSDNTHSPFLIESMISKLESFNLDLVVASRFIAGGCELGLSTVRKLYSRGAMYFFKLFFPIANLNDYSSGFRAYKVRSLRRAYAHWGQLVTTTGFDCMAEIAAKFSRIGVRAAEVPLILNYDLKEGSSKMRVGRTIKGYFSLLGKVR